MQGVKPSAKARRAAASTGARTQQSNKQQLQDAEHTVISLKCTRETITVFTQGDPGIARCF